MWNNAVDSVAIMPGVEPDASKPTGDVADTGKVADIGPGVDQPEQPPVPAPPPAASPASTTPPLQRNPVYQKSESAASQQQDPLPSSTAVEPAPTDSLSLLQLRRIVAEVHRAEPIAYDFEYTDIGPHAEEIDEWFTYQFWQWVRLNSAQRAFEWHWENEDAGAENWETADDDSRVRFVRAAISGIQSNDAALRFASVGKLMYLVLGRWASTANPNIQVDDCRSVASIPQLEAIKEGVLLLVNMDGLPVVWEALTAGFERQWNHSDSQQGIPQESNDELLNLMTIMYIVIQQTLNDHEDMTAAHAKLLELNPSLVEFMMEATFKLRWDEQVVIPQAQIFLLFWKSILVVFGGLEELEAVKVATGEEDADGLGRETITASPLDYHVFRQEITSKYPAYVPPRPAIPLEDDNTSMLPPLPNQVGRNSANSGILPAHPDAQNGGASILNQPVHIATPAPSPPPSPAIGGKGGKKQNYQTNQNFPFMYPPLDASSNSAGGKGLAGIHEALIGRKWEGSDIPASILEAGQIFSSRVRMNRATRQLWEEREKFLRHERGWDQEDGDDDEIEDLDLGELTLEEKEILKEFKAEGKEKRPPPQADVDVDFGPRPERLSEADKKKLIAVENFYRKSLPHLQSLVIVLLRPILANVTAIVAQQSAAQGPGMMGGRGMMGGARPPPDGQAQSPRPDVQEVSLEGVDAARTREITSKAMTGILLLLMKWFRVSHVLKFEYLSQLLVDSNYVPLVLKLFAHQDIQQVVDSKTDRVEHSFFHFCNLGSKLQDKSKDAGEEDGVPTGAEPNDAEKADEGEGEHEEEEEDSEDDAAPPPIRKKRASPEPSVSSLRQTIHTNRFAGPSARPEVDELGYPTTTLPEEPITDFSRRNFFSLINYLRVMQKICKKKAHRNLLLVQYKSSTIIRKSLKIPQPELRLYTLKLFKNQVPYCGRKWRQGNMRVITAVYLHCRPELRDEWLAGSDVDGEVDSALPLEQALRSLTHWLNLRRYPEGIAPDIRTAMREEQDFFSRELERLNIGWSEWGEDGMSDMDHVEGWA